MAKPNFNIGGLLALQNYVEWRTCSLSLKQLLILYFLWENGAMPVHDVIQNLKQSSDKVTIDQENYFFKLLTPLCFRRSFGTKKPVLEFVNFHQASKTLSLTKQGKEMMAGVFGPSPFFRLS